MQAGCPDLETLLFSNCFCPGGAGLCVSQASQLAKAGEFAVSVLRQVWWCQCCLPTVLRAGPIALWNLNHFEALACFVASAAAL